MEAQENVQDRGIDYQDTFVWNKITFLQLYEVIVKTWGSGSAIPYLHMINYKMLLKENIQQKNIIPLDQFHNKVMCMYLMKLNIS